MLAGTRGIKHGITSSIQRALTLNYTQQPAVRMTCLYYTSYHYSGKMKKKIHFIKFNVFLFFKLLCTMAHTLFVLKNQHLMIEEDFMQNVERLG